MHASYARASKTMAEIFYSGMTEEEIDAFEATLRKILDNLEALD